MADWQYVTAKANAELDAEFRNDLYFAAYTAVPAADGTGGTEASYTGYARAQLTTSNMSAASSRSITNSVTITCGTANSGSSQTATHWVIFSASSGGTATSMGEFSTNYVVAPASSLTFAPGQLTITLPTSVS